MRKNASQGRDLGSTITISMFALCSNQNQDTLFLLLSFSMVAKSMRTPLELLSEGWLSESIGSSMRELMRKC